MFPAFNKVCVMEQNYLASIRSALALDHTHDSALPLFHVDDRTTWTWPEFAHAVLVDPVQSNGTRLRPEHVRAMLAKPLNEEALVRILTRVGFQVLLCLTGLVHSYNTLSEASSQVLAEVLQYLEDPWRAEAMEKAYQDQLAQEVTATLPPGLESKVKATLSMEEKRKIVQAAVLRRSTSSIAVPTGMAMALAREGDDGARRDHRAAGVGQGVDLRRRSAGWR